MGRSNGYRPKAAVRDEVGMLRAALGELQDDQWVKASFIMEEITKLLGHRGGPMGGKIEPRICKYCKYYGHTRQWCKVRLEAEKSRDDRETDKLLAEDRASGALCYTPPDTPWARWCQGADEAYRQLIEIKEDWDPDEWETEFRKRAGYFDHSKF